MTERPKFFDDLAGVAGGALSALAGLREEVTALVRARVEEAVRKLDLVKRDEFEALSEVASRARMQAEALEARVNILEGRAMAEARKEATPAAPPAEAPPTPPWSQAGMAQPPSALGEERAGGSPAEDGEPLTGL